MGKIGALDLAVRQWPDFVTKLQANVQAGAPAGVKQATLEALGYVCEDLDPAALEQTQVNCMLTAVVAGMGAGEEAATRVVATKALDNALVFAKENFCNEAERTYLMRMVCEGAVAPEVEARRARRAGKPAKAACPNCLLAPVTLARPAPAARAHAQRAALLHATHVRHALFTPLTPLRPLLRIASV